MYAVGDTCGFQLFDKCFAVFYEQGVLGVCARVAFCYGLQCDSFKAFEKFVVAPGVFSPHFEFFFEVAQLYAEYGCLKCIEPAVHADDLVQVALATPMVRYHADFFRELYVVCKQGSAVAVAAERLARVEARNGNIAEGAGLLPVLGRAERLCGIFQYPKPVPVCDFAEFLVRGALPEQVHGDDSLGPGADQRFYALGRNLERPRVDVREFRDGSEPCHAFGGGDEREIRNDDLVPWLDVESKEGYSNGVGSACAGGCVFCSREGCELRFKLCYFVAAYIDTAVEDGFFGCFELFTVGVPLRLDVHERNHGCKYRNDWVVGVDDKKNNEIC